MELPVSACDPLTFLLRRARYNSNPTDAIQTTRAEQLVQLVVRIECHGRQSISLFGDCESNSSSLYPAIVNQSLSLSDTIAFAGRNSR